MQKLYGRNTYTPPNTAQVRCNCDSLLNSLLWVMGSVTSLKTSYNNSEEHLLGNRRKTLC